MKTPVLLAYFLITAVTLTYCLAIWYGAGLWHIFFESNQAGISPVFCLGIAPLPLPGVWFGSIHWQLLAMASLIWAFVWGKKRFLENPGETAYLLPLILHIAWILFAVLLHIVGTLAPMIAIGHSLA